MKRSKQLLWFEIVCFRAGLSVKLQLIRLAQFEHPCSLYVRMCVSALKAPYRLEVFYITGPLCSLWIFLYFSLAAHTHCIPLIIPLGDASLFLEVLCVCARACVFSYEHLVMYVLYTAIVFFTDQNDFLSVIRGAFSFKAHLSEAD